MKRLDREYLSDWANMLHSRLLRSEKNQLALDRENEIYTTQGLWRSLALIFNTTTFNSREYLE